MSASASSAPIAPAGFFVLRTPLLPFDELLAWGANLAAPAVLDDTAALEQALAADKTRLRAHLRALLHQPAIRDAIFVASPDLDASLHHWIEDPASKHGQKIERSLSRYVQRMAGRATPFGLFAGWSVGALGSTTSLALGPRAGYERHTRLDMDYLFALADGIVHDPVLRATLHYRPNSSLYRAAGRLRYAEGRLNERTRSYHLVAVETSVELDATLERAVGGANAQSLAAALVAANPDIAPAEAEAYIAELIDSQILVPDLAPAVTGDEPIHGMIARLQAHAATTGIATHLDQARSALATLDADGLGATPDRYRAIARLLDGLPAQTEIARLFQVDMAKPAAIAVLGEAVIAEIARGVALLHRLPARRSDGLQQFREAFFNRYEQRTIPLVEVLDEDVGIGFGNGRNAGGATAPLLAGLALPSPATEPTITWNGLHALLLEQLQEAARQGAQEITLAAEALEQLSASNALPLPNSFAVMATIAATDEAALERGDFHVLLEGVSGPSGARLLGRFCHADPALHRHVEALLRAEEQHASAAVFAEIAHLPEGRIGNVICRPVLRDYEIVYLGASGAPLAKQIPITDLLVAVEGGRIVLRSARLGCEVIPRLTSAHNYVWRSLAIYRFLCAVQNQGVAGGLGWDWGALESAAFLPRVMCGRLVLARARWRAQDNELRTLGAAKGVAQFQAVQAWRSNRRLPRFVVLADGDNELPVDFDNVLSVETFVDLVKNRSQIVLYELFPGPDALCAQGPEGRFVHELVVPFIKPPTADHQIGNPNSTRQAPRTTQYLSTTLRAGAIRHFPPGSAWLYAKLYTGAGVADQVLCDVVWPVTAAATQSGAAQSWFFIRYGDPDHHLRLRLHGPPERLIGEVLPALHAAVAPLLEDGQVLRLQLDTYEREIERYGGDDGIVWAEQLFHADSEAVLGIIELLAGDSGADARWRLALRGMDMLLHDMGFDTATRHRVIQQARDNYLREFRADAYLKRQLGDIYRRHRRGLELLRDPAHDEQSELASGLALFRARSKRLAPVVAALRTAERSERLTVSLTDLAPSYLHMHANRLLRSSQRAHELVIYELLYRLYEGQAARAR